MNSTISNNGGTAIGELIAKVMNKFDADGDKKLSTSEFSNFLTGLLGGTGMASATAQAAETKGPGPRTGEYRSLLSGFDHIKMDNPGISGAGTSKYIAARIFQDYKPMPESLPAVVERLRAQGINAMQTDHDKIDFGDGFGPIDVIQGAYSGGGVAWQWVPRE